MTERSCWVTPCWTRSPITTSMMRSNGSMLDSSAMPDHAHENPDEDENDGRADDDVHYGKMVISWSRARIGSPPSSSTTPWSFVPIVVGLTWYCRRTTSSAPDGTAS